MKCVYVYFTSRMCVTVGISCPLEGMQTSFISTVTASLSALPPFLTSVNSSLHRDWPGAVLGLPAVWAEPGVGGECNGEDRARVGQRLSYVRVLLWASATLLSCAGVINTGVSSQRWEFAGDKPRSNKSNFWGVIQYQATQMSSKFGHRSAICRRITAI